MEVQELIFAVFPSMTDDFLTEICRGLILGALSTRKLGKFISRLWSGNRFKLRVIFF